MTIEEWILKKAIDTYGKEAQSGRGRVRELRAKPKGMAGNDFIKLQFDLC